MSTEQDPNPYAPPATSLALDRPSDSPAIVPARRLTRFAGSALDGLIVGVPLLVVVFAMGGFDDPESLQRLGPVYFAVVTANLLGFGLNVWFWSRRAQSIGKLIVGTRIATPDGRPAGLRRILVRQVPLFLLAMAPAAVNTLTSVLSFLDAAAILRADRRCLHDHLAGTIVVVAGPANDPAEVERA